jgi:hypothetical protein
MNLTPLFVLPIALSLLSGCAVNQTMKEEARALNWQVPTDAQNQILDYMGSRLKDPESARYEWTPKPVRMVWFFGAVYGGYKPVWVWQFNVNAKNSYGGYTGMKARYALWDPDGRNGRIVNGYVPAYPPEPLD